MAINKQTKDENTSVNFYDLLRNEARNMGHKVANLPDDVWDKYVQMKYKRNVLTESKVFIKNYMMGDLEPSRLAYIMANNDSLRYTISDICRAKLEPKDIDIQHNDKYVDLKAGAKTFWTEMHVPLPSEVDVARDLRNIYFGIEAGRATVDVQQKDIQKNTSNKSFRERISEARQSLAQKAIDKLTPIAEGQDNDTNEAVNKTNTNKSLLDTLQAMGIDPKSTIDAYNAVVQRQAVQTLENLTMAMEASKDENLDSEQRMKALMSTGISENDAKDLIFGSQSNHSMDEKSMKELKNNELFSNKESYKSGYSVEELNRPINDEMKELFDQIYAHVNRDKAAQREGQKPAKETIQEKRLRKGYVAGEFEGERVQFKGTWSNHTFTTDEVNKLLAGESIAFSYTDSKNREKEISGKLEWQNYDGQKYLGFKPDFSKKKTTESQEQPLNQDYDLFSDQDAAFALDYDELNQLFDSSPDMADDIAAYENMKASGELDDAPVCYARDDDEIELTDADVPPIEVPNVQMAQ